MTKRAEIQWIFQSTLPRGERPGFSSKFINISYFNPRSREGSDKYPPRVAKKYTYFNPRSREGSDNLTRIWCQRDGGFQSTLPRGERRQVTKVLSSIPEFQSTLPRGERLEQTLILSAKYLFQSTLPRGERRKLNGGINKIKRFQSTLPRGERRYMSGIYAKTFYFNPRSREGSDYNYHPTPPVSL